MQLMLVLMFQHTGKLVRLTKMHCVYRRALADPQSHEWRQAAYLKEALMCANSWMSFSFPVTCVPVPLLLLTDLPLLTRFAPDLALWILNTDLSSPLTALSLLFWY